MNPVSWHFNQDKKKIEKNELQHRLSAILNRLRKNIDKELISMVGVSWRKCFEIICRLSVIHITY